MPQVFFHWDHLDAAGHGPPYLRRASCSRYFAYHHKLLALKGLSAGRCIHSPLDGLHEIGDDLFSADHPDHLRGPGHIAGELVDFVGGDYYHAAFRDGMRAAEHHLWGSAHLHHLAPPGLLVHIGQLDMHGVEALGNLFFNTEGIQGAGGGGENFRAFRD